MFQQTFKIMPRTLNQNLSKLRKSGIIPGIMYGQSREQSLPIEIPLKTLQMIIKDTTNAIFPIELEGEIYNCVLRAFQTDRLHTEILHVDLQFVKPGENIKLNIPMIYEGLQHLSARKYILEKALSRIPVQGPVEILPEAFTVDVGTMKRGDKIFIRDLKLPPNIEILANPETIVATIQ